MPRLRGCPSITTTVPQFGQALAGNRFAEGMATKLSSAWAGSHEGLQGPFLCRCNTRKPLNKTVLVWMVFDGTAKAVRTAVRGLPAGFRPLEFRPCPGCWRLNGALRPALSRSNCALRRQLTLRRQQITQPEQQRQPLHVLRQPPVAHLAVTEQPLQLQEGMLHLGPH